MRYAKIHSLDISNGEGVGVAIFVQGCHFHCTGCFNPETWDFNGGKEWNKEIEEQFISLISKPYIKRVSILGGEPLADENVEFTLHVMSLVGEVCEQYNREIMVWIYTGYTFENICDLKNKQNNDPLNLVLDWAEGKTSETFNEVTTKFADKVLRNEILKYCDYLVDGKFEIDKQDLTYSKVKFAGSTNQRIIDIQKTLEKGEIVLYEQNS